MSALPWGSRGGLRGVHSTDPNLAFPFDSMTLPSYQPHADYLIPPGKILEFTHGPEQKKKKKKLALLNHLFPTFRSLEGEMPVSFYPLFEIPSAQRESPYL